MDKNTYSDLVNELEQLFYFAKINAIHYEDLYNLNCEEVHQLIKTVNDENDQLIEKYKYLKKLIKNNKNSSISEIKFRKCISLYSTFKNNIEKYEKCIEEWINNNKQNLINTKTITDCVDNKSLNCLAYRQTDQNIENIEIIIEDIDELKECNKIVQELILMQNDINKKLKDDCEMLEIIDENVELTKIQSNKTLNIISDTVDSKINYTGTEVILTATSIAAGGVFGGIFGSILTGISTNRLIHYIKK